MTAAEAPPQRKTLFTAETAQLAAHKSVAARRLKAERLKAERLAAKNQPPPAEHPPPAAVQPAAQTAIASQLSLVESLISRTRAIVEDGDESKCEHCKRSGHIEPHHRAQLLKALDSLLDRQRVLLGIPLPGSLKPSSPKERRRGIPNAEIIAMPTPSPAPEPLPLPPIPEVTAAATAPQRQPCQPPQPLPESAGPLPLSPAASRLWPNSPAVAPQLAQCKPAAAPVPPSSPPATPSPVRAAVTPRRLVWGPGGRLVYR